MIEFTSDTYEKDHDMFEKARDAVAERNNFSRHAQIKNIANKVINDVTGGHHARVEEIRQGAGIIEIHCDGTISSSERKQIIHKLAALTGQREEYYKIVAFHS